MELKGKKINFLGDSITAGCCASSPNLGFVEVMERRYQLKQASNYGIGGTRIARQHTPSPDPRYDRDFCGRITEMDPDADIVVVFGGTNDHGHGDAPLGIPADRTHDTFYGACYTLFSGLRLRYPTAIILVVTPLHRTGDREPKFPENTLLSDYVRALRETASMFDLPVLDLFETSAINHRLEDLTTDLLHPNDQGHQILAREIGDFLLKL